MEASGLIHSLIHNLSALYNRESDQILQEQLGIGFAQYKILGLLLENAASQQKHLAVAIGQTEASVSRQIRLLQEKDLIYMQVNPDNRREHQIALTARGERITEAARQVLTNFQATSLQHLSSKDQVKLLQLLANTAK